MNHRERALAYWIPAAAVAVLTLWLFGTVNLTCPDLVVPPGPRCDNQGGVEIVTRIALTLFAFALTLFLVLRGVRELRRG